MNDLVISKAHRIILIDDRNCSLGILTFIKSLKCFSFSSITFKWRFQIQLRKTYHEWQISKGHHSLWLEKHSILSSSFPTPSSSYLPFLLFFLLPLLPLVILSFFFYSTSPPSPILVKKKMHAVKSLNTKVFSFYRLFSLFHS